MISCDYENFLRTKFMGSWGKKTALTALHWEGGTPHCKNVYWEGDTAHTLLIGTPTRQPSDNIQKTSRLLPDTLKTPQIL